MTRLNPNKLKVRFLPFPQSLDVLIPRRYTLTHSDRTGELFLTVGPEYDKKQVRGLFSRLMRDEIFAELVQKADECILNVYCQVSRGLGSRRFREGIFRRELPLVLESIRYGDREFFEKNGMFDKAQVIIHFCAKKSENDKTENWGSIGSYSISFG